MANVIKIKRSTNNTAPGSLEFGELALSSNGNTVKLYAGDSSNAVKTLLDTSASSVTSFVTTLSGLTPNTSPATGAVTLAGTLGVTSGGTGSTSAPTPGGVVYGINSSAIGTITAGTAGDLLISNGSGAPAWTDALGVSNRKVIIKGGTANVANFNLGTGAKNPTVADGDFWWGPNDKLYFKPIDPAPIKTLAYSTDIGDGTLTIATSGTGLSVGSPSTFSANQSGNATITITSNANTANGANTIVARDASGNFAAGTITAALDGNASTATSAAAWKTARTITLSGDLTGNVSINGSQNVTLDATIAAKSVQLGTDTTGNYVANVVGTVNQIVVARDVAEGAISTVSLSDNVSITSNLTVGGNLTVNGDTVTVNTATLNVEDPLIKLATGNSANSIDIGFYGQYDGGESTEYAGLFRDASDSGKFKLFTGLDPEPTTTVNTGDPTYAIGTLVANLEGNASTASAWATGRTISLTGDVTGEVTGVTGSGNISISTTIAANSVALGTDTTGNYVATISAGTGMSVSGSGNESAAVTVTNNDRGSSQNIFKNIAVSGQTTVVADSNDDTLTFVAGTGITLTTNATSDSVTITNASPDQTVSLTGSGSVSISGTYPNFTISGTDTNTTYSAGTGLNLTGTTFSLSHLGIQNLADPNNDRILFWDDSATKTEWLTLGSNLSITGTTINATNTTYTAGTGLSLAGTVFSIDSTVLTDSSTIDGGTY